MNRMIQTTGVVTRRSGVFPQLKYVKFECVKCKAILGPYYQDSDKEIKVGRCGECSSQGPFSVNSEQVRIDFCVDRVFELIVIRPHTEIIRN